MNRTYQYAIIGISLAALMQSCTGDPRRGGIFWSESQAQERLEGMRGDLQARQQEIGKVESRNRSASAKIRSQQQRVSQLRRELSDLRERGVSEGSSRRESAREAELKREIERLERDIAEQQKTMDESMFY